MPAAVVDSYAILALLFEEPGAEQVETLLTRAADADRPVLMAAPNWAEVLYLIEREQGAEGVKEAKRFASTMPLEIAATDRSLAELAAPFKAAHKMSLADAFAAALAKQKRATLVTGNPEFKPLGREIKIQWLK